MSYGYCGKIARINLTTGKITVEALEMNVARNYIGGRGLNMRRLYDEIPAKLPGMHPDNKLFFAVSPLVATLVPGSGRFNVSAKSPQTGILGDSNAGGFFGAELKFAGFDQLIIEGQSAKPVYIYIHNDQIELRDARHIWGKDIWETQRIILQELRDARVQVAAIGLAAENGVKFAGIFANLVRAAARTGMGAVMGAKNVKAIAVRGTKPVRIAHPQEFAALLQQIDKAIYAHNEFPTRAMMGTTKLVHALNEAGCLATRHFQTGRFVEADAVSGEALAETVKTKSKACFSCTIPCSRFFNITQGRFAGLQSEGPEFEGLAGFSSRVGVTDLASSLKAVDLCNRYGIDVISTSEMVSFVMELYEQGIITSKEADGLDLAWGNVDTVLTLIEKMAKREGFGDILADGVKEAASKIGRGSDKYAFHVKGLELFQADPRGLKAYALGYAVASRGGDHLRSEPSFEFSNDAAAGEALYGHADAAFRLKYKGKGRVVKHYEEWCALSDCLEICKNTVVNMEIINFDLAAQLMAAATGQDFSGAGMQQICERVVNLERAFNVREGITRKDDTLPYRFTHEPLPADSGPSSGSVVELEPMLDEYYQARGWDVTAGIPTAQTLERLGLDRELADLRKLGFIDE
ncbi:MAG: aldehyde ferredoxin oxidoreductase family protein [Sporomusa sp.]